MSCTGRVLDGVSRIIMHSVVGPLVLHRATMQSVTILPLSQQRARLEDGSAYWKLLIAHFARIWLCYY